MANLRIATATRNAMLDALVAQLDVAAGAGTIKIYSGTQPTNANTALAGNTLLATLTFSVTSAPAASNGTITFSAITEDTSADATGTATFARIESGTPATIFDCDVGTSGASINLNTTSIVTGGPVRITSASISIAAA